MTSRQDQNGEQPGPGSPHFADLMAAAALGGQAHGIEIGTATAPEGMKGVPATIPVALRRGGDPAVVDISSLFENYRAFPERKTGTANVDTLESFIELTRRHKVEASAIFANMDWRKPSLTAVIDYHEAQSGGQAAFGRHRVHYAFPLSEEWKAWIAMNGEKMKQADFAWFLEDRIPELSAPTEEEKIRFERDFSTTVATPAQVVELSRGLQVNIDAKVKNAVTVASGEGQVVFEESHTDSAGGKLKVPGIFVLSIAPFFMGEAVRIPVRLRYRAQGGTIVWFYEIWRPDQVITEHVRHAFKDATKATELPGFEGRPEMQGSAA